MSKKLKKSNKEIVNELTLKEQEQENEQDFFVEFDDDTGNILFVVVLKHKWGDPIETELEYSFTLEEGVELAKQILKFSNLMELRKMRIEMEKEKVISENESVTNEVNKKDKNYDGI